MKNLQAFSEQNFLSLSTSIAEFPACSHFSPEQMNSHIIHLDETKKSSSRVMNQTLLE